MRAVFVHSQPKSRKDLILLQNAELIVSVLSENCLTKHLNINHSLPLVICSEEEIYATNQKAKDKWNSELCERLKLRPKTIYTNAGASRSEFSSAIEAFSNWLLVKDKFKGFNGPISVITKNKDLKYLINRGNKNYIHIFCFFFLSIMHFMYRNILDFSFDVLYFSILKFLRNTNHHNRNEILTFSLLNHWSNGYDWRYGKFFSENYKYNYMIAVLRCGGLQTYDLFSWIKATNNCLAADNSLIIEKYCDWMSFFKLVGSDIKYKFDILLAFLKVFFKREHSINYVLEYLLILEENRYASNYFSNGIVYIGVTSILEIIKPSKVLNYHFEFPVGRSIAKASKSQSFQVYSYGLQHGPISRGKWCYDLSSLMCKDSTLKNYCPNTYLLEGEYAAWVIGKYVGNHKIKLVGAPRHDAIDFLHNKNVTQISSGITNLSNKTAVFLMDLHVTARVSIIHISKIIQDMPQLENLIVRPHPRDLGAETKLNLIKLTFLELNVTSSHASLDIETLKFKNLLVWGESTGALLDCLGFGHTIKVLRLPGKIILDPIIDFEYHIEEINAQCRSKPEGLMTHSPGYVFRMLFHKSKKSASYMIFSHLDL